MSDSAKPVWFITGCSTGFGRALAEHLLANGYPTVVTARDVAQVADLAADKDNALSLKLDVTRPADIDTAVAAATARFGRIDVLVNNAGIGYFGAVEESDETEIRRMFEINVFGLANMSKAVLPGMRANRSGTIVNISSIGGIRSSPTVGFYNASKYAVEGLSESLSLEVAPLGIKVLIVEPSGFRTDWAGRSANEATHIIEDYDATAGQNRRNLRAYDGNQPGDPDRAAQAIVKAVEAENPPLRLLLGRMALAGGRAKIAMLQRDFEAWAETTEWADNPAG
jgi:NAD(P)-dependent dehydrogenase (short-subunit alcohol dehydrogenase family)